MPFSWPRTLRAFRMLLALVLAAGGAVAVLVPAAPASAGGPAAGGEIIVITDVRVGSSLVTNACGHDLPVLPVTIDATFLPPPGQEPTGPYATGSWSGGFGSEDDHFGTRQAHAFHQVFHVLLTPSSFDYYGEGVYDVSVTVQDVGLAGGFTERDNIEADIGPNPPTAAPATIKCPLIRPAFDDQQYAFGLAKSFAKAIIKETCGICKVVFQLYGYSNSAAHLLGEGLLDLGERDPPDDRFETVPVATPPPLPAPPTGLTTNERAAAVQLETDLLAALGDTRAAESEVDRAWGAANAGSQYWYRRQRQALATDSAALATALRLLPADFAALQASFGTTIPSFPVTDDDASAMRASLFDALLPANELGYFTALGGTTADEQEIAEWLLAADTGDDTTADGSPDLFAAPADYATLADAVSGLGRWAAGTLDEQPPAVAKISSASAPASGWTQLTVTGSNLDTVTGLSFGASTPDSGLGHNLICEQGTCTAEVPAGTGTVDVTAYGPGGVSARVPADRFTYRASARPAVTRVFPHSGSPTGYPTVAVHGSGLAGATVFFGASPAAGQQCSDTLCTAQAPLSAVPGTVDVVVRTDGGTSAAVADDRFTFVADGGPAPPAPTVTAVSPTQGNSVGGDTVTVTGTGFDTVSAVDVGDSSATSFDVVDSTHLTAVTPPGAGTVDVTLTGNGGTSALSTHDRFTYADRAPVITAVAPTSGPDTGGTTITITGHDLNDGSVFVGDGAQDDFGSCTPTRCTVVTPPATAGAHELDVDTGDGSATSTFTYVTAPAPAITGLSAVTGSSLGDNDLVVYGTNLAGGSVTIGGHDADDADLLGCAQTACTVSTPAGTPGPTTVVVTRPDGTHSAGVAYRYVRPHAPSISYVSPVSGWSTATVPVTVLGHDLAGATIAFGSTPASSASGAAACTQDSCVVVPESDSGTSGTVDVTAHTAAGTSPRTAADRYTFLVPRITAVTPTSGWSIGGTPVTITGAHLAGLHVDFGGASADDITCTDTQCTGTAPEYGSAATVPITAQDDAGDAFTDPDGAPTFTYKSLPAPAVTAVSPASGSVDGGDRVVVTGTFLERGTVDIGGEQATGTCQATSCTVIAPDAFEPGPVDVTVTNATATSPVTSAGRYTYRAERTPTVTGVSPGSGSAAGGDRVVITGTDLSNTELAFGDAAVGTATCTATSCTVLAPSHGAGPVDVQAVNGAGTSAHTSADRFTFVTPPAPTVTSVSPATGPASGGTYVTVTGTNLTNAGLSFGGTPGIDATCSATSCTVSEPARAAGTVDVRASAAGGTSAAVAADRFTVSAVRVTQVHIPHIDNPGRGGHLVSGSDGTTWFAMPGDDDIGKVSASGVVSVLPTLDQGASTTGIARTADGLVWYVEAEPDTIVSIDASGHQTAHRVAGQPDDLRGLTVGPDGRLWFLEAYSGAVGAMTEDGHVTLYRLPSTYGYPVNLTVGPDARIWFTEEGGTIGAITTAGTVSEYPVSVSGSTPFDITSGPDGRLWFTEFNALTLGAIDTSGVVTRYHLPAGEGSPLGIVDGADGRVWFTESGFDQVSAFDPRTGTDVDYPLADGYVGAQPKYVTLAHDGSLWATDFSDTFLVHVTGITAGVAPAVTSVAPRRGASAGGTAVIITGANVGGATAVHFGTAAATSVTALDPAHVRAVAPAGSGTVDVTVTTPRGTTPTGGADRYTYGSTLPPTPVVSRIAPTTGSTAGGTGVTITGSHLSGGTVAFGTAAATGVSCSASSCTATAPAGVAGQVHVRVHTGGGTSAQTPADVFTYLTPAPDAPTVTGVSPAQGPTTGGTSVTITGTHMSGALVYFGLTVAVAHCLSTRCAATAPPGGTGTVDIRVQTGGGTSPPTTADRYAYG